MQRSAPTISVDQREAKIHRLRIVLLLTSVGILLLLLAAWWLIRSFTAEPAPLPHVSIFERKFPQLEQVDSNSAVQLLELADVQVNELLREFPDSPRAYDVKANRDYMVSDISGAQQAWEKALELDATFGDALHGIAMLAFERGDYQTTISVGERLVRTKHDNRRLPLLLADAYIHQGEFDKAILTLEQHVTSESSSVQALEMLGRAHLSNRNHDKAIACFERVLTHDDQSKDAYFGLGQAYTRLGQREQAQEFMTRFQELSRAGSSANARDAQAFVDRDHAAHVAAQVSLDSALVYRSVGNTDQTEKLFLQALQLEPDVTSWLVELKRFYQAQQRPMAAVDVLQRLVELEPDVPDHWLTLGGLYAELEQPDPAVDAFQRAIELAPDDPRCQQARAIIRQLK